MGKRRFEIRLDGLVEIELDDRVIDVVDDDWRASLYSLHTPEQIAEHIAYNMVINKWGLSVLDGWADQPDENARVIPGGDWDMDATEIKAE